MSSAHETTVSSVPMPGRLESAWKRRVVWLTDERRDLLGATSAAPALIAVLGREHYTERRRKYPIHSRRDLEAVLAQELANEPLTLTVIGKPDQDKREVTFFGLRPDVPARIGTALWLLPESLLLAMTMPAGRVADVERDGYRYFLSGTGVSQPGGGVVATPELFALATGLDVGAGLLQFDRQAIARRLTLGMRSLPASAWLRLRRPAWERQTAVEWRWLATAAGIAAVAYLALVSGYLFLTQESRETQLAGLGEEVESLLAAQRQVDALAARRAGLEKVLNDRVESHYVWRVVGLAWGKGAQLSAIEVKDADLTLRGRAPIATDVLAVLDQAQEVTQAKFSAPVRGGRDGLEEFVISMRLVRDGQGG